MREREGTTMKKNFKEYGSWLIVTMQEAYSAIIPYFLLLSILALLIELSRYFQIPILGIDTQEFSSVVDSLDLFASIVTAMSIAYFVARRLETSTIMAMILAIASYATVMVLEESDALFLYGYSYGFVIQTIFIPVFSTVMLRLLYPYFNMGIPIEDQNMHIYQLINYLFVFLGAYFVTILCYEAIDYVMDGLIDMLDEYDFSAIPMELLAFGRNLVVSFFWFLGIHGDHTVGAIFGTALLGKEIVPSLTLEEFNTLFVYLGGSGVGIAILVSLLMYAKEGILKTISRISVPFVFFNIDILLIYAVIVFNRYLLIPFLLVPLLNFGIAYGVLEVMPVAFMPDVELTWMTPIFLNSYLKSGGNMEVLLLQAVLVVVDTLIYAYFMKRFFEAKSHILQVERLQKSFDLPYKIQINNKNRPIFAYKSMIDTSVKLEQVIAKIDVKRLMLYFQPKISMATGQCGHLEALIRYQYPNGKVAVPEFLALVEETQMSPIVDMWVVKEVAAILNEWEEQGAKLPTVSINLHPDTLSNMPTLKAIAKILDGRQIVFEVIERSFMEGKSGIEGFNFLQSKGFGIAIDDYGVGYSNLEFILNYRVDELKIDKNIIDRLDDEKGALVCEHVIAMGKHLNIDVTAEGVETIETTILLERMGISYIQGFYFSAAIPKDAVLGFMEHFRLENKIPELSGTSTPPI